MLEFGLAQKPNGYRILCLGSHCDDIEIGCGGTILRLLRQHSNCSVQWIVFSSNQERAQEATASANAFLSDAGDKKIILKDFRDGFFPYDGIAIKTFFEQLKTEYSPDIVFTHFRDDLHQDHRLICELTWNTFRSHLILEYEVPKYDGDLGSPNCFVELDRSTCERKIRYIVNSFVSQRSKHWFSEETFFSLLRLRGMESRASSSYAEAFYCRKMVLGL